jgi:hypothetical protein
MRTPERLYATVTIRIPIEPSVRLIGKPIAGAPGWARPESRKGLPQATAPSGVPSS